ncbi:MAG TPA: patatin-like phospholipase family protein [Streptosporangiaceae bacterium]|jgi:NTE family protein|nr:patatin-like phospholipase family protein [Streptosporangiaceae bacterium]
MAVDVSGRALVLGGGGIAGVAWEAGMLAGLKEAGVDLTTADLIIGTSAGSIVGSFVAHGVDVAEAIEGLSGESAADRPSDPVDMDAVLNAFAILFDPGITPQDARVQVGKLALEAKVDGARERLADIGLRLPRREWPARPLLVTAVDTADGAFVVWDRDSGVPLPDAVMASCCVPCVFPPIDINGRRYMDGGTRSITNADLAKGASAVVILEPMAHVSPRTVLAAELRELGAARVAAIGPDQGAIEVFGVNVLDPALWQPAFRAGRAQSAAAADEVRAVWNA